MKDNFCLLLDEIERTHIDIAFEYLNYWKLALAIAGEYGEPGREYFHRICRQSVKYDERDAEYRYTNALRSGRGVVHIATVFFLADAAGVKIPKECHYDPKGMVAREPAQASVEIATVSQVTNDKGNDDDSVAQRGKASKRHAAAIGDIKGFLANFCFRYNTVSHKIEYRPANGTQWQWLDDRTANTLWCEFCSKGYRCSIGDFNTVINSDFAKPFNPFAQYFGNLPEWKHDAPDYIEELTDRITLVDETPEKREYLRKCFKKWLVGMVAGVLRDDFVNQYILTLLGRQGIYKSSFFNRLLPPVLREHFHAQLFKGKTDRDDQFAMAHNMLICIEELDNVSQNEMNRLKAQTTITHIDERKVYGRYTEHMARNNSFAATGNNTRILNDLTGNRRWLVFNVESIESPYKHPLNYDGIYSEAKALMEESEDNYVFTTDDNAEITLMNRDFESVCMEEELIMKYFALPTDSDKSTLMSATDIIAKINVWVKDRLSVSKVGTLMKKMGFEQRKIRGATKYRVYERTEAEVKLLESEEAKMAAEPKAEAEQQALPF